MTPLDLNFLTIYLFSVLSSVNNKHIMARQISLVFVTFLTVASSVAAIIHESLCPNLTENAVDLGYAKYVSSTNGLGVNEFLGMRFAAPPLGDLRFRAPQDALPENETIKADKVSLF